jgi:transketolase
VFNGQDKAYQESVLPSTVQKRIAIEAGATLGWHRYVGSQGRIIGIDRYGESAPADQIYKALGLTVESIVKAVNEMTSQ